MMRRYGQRGRGLPVGAVAGLVVGLSGSPAVHACATCFGASDSAMARGMNLGILSLLGVIGFVLAMIVTVAISLALRASRLARAEVRRVGVEATRLDREDASRLMRPVGEWK